MADKIIFWIGAICIGLCAIRFTWCLTGVFLGWMLKRFKWDSHCIYLVDLADLMDKRDG